MILNSQKQNSGFTLVEATVSVFIVAIIFSVVGSIFASSLALQRRALGAQKVQENLNVVMEYIAREVRVADNFVSGDSGCPSTPATTLSFHHPVNGDIVYSLSNSVIHRNVGGTDSIISSNNIQFSSLKFCLAGTGGSTGQPRVTIFGTVKSNDPKQSVSSDFQTTVSVRALWH